MAVDLPAPVCPTSATVLPGDAAKETSRRMGGPPGQNAFSTAPMMVQPTTLFTPSMIVSAGFRIAKA